MLVAWDCRWLKENPYLGSSALFCEPNASVANCVGFILVLLVKGDNALKEVHTFH